MGVEEIDGAVGTGDVTVEGDREEGDDVGCRHSNIMPHVRM
jgi:hypothetical protein